MSDLNRSTSPSSSASFRAPKDEQILAEQVLEEERLAGGSDGAAVSSGNPANATPAWELEEADDDENEAVSSGAKQTNNPPINGSRRPAGVPQPSARFATFNPSTFVIGTSCL
ncbi:hypothetical protein BDZ89DRAFT_418982 [Hymenopellis radicata]|nr:hypothetical protein BDZ89DRAFT_418982 [Hymenopellis radicata]